MPSGGEDEEEVVSSIEFGRLGDERLARLQSSAAAARRKIRGLAAKLDRASRAAEFREINNRALCNSSLGKIINQRDDFFFSESLTNFGKMNSQLGSSQRN